MVRKSTTLEELRPSPPARLSNTNGPEDRKVEAITIPAPRMEVAAFELQFTAPFMQHRFSQKAQQQIEATQRAGSTAKKGKKRDPRDFEADFKAATYRTPDGGYGIPASAFRGALIEACRMTGFHMTKAKMSVFVLPDAIDSLDEQTPLVSLGKQTPTADVRPARNDNGSVDIRSRPRWAPGLRCTLRVRYDADQFTRQDVAHLVMRAGLQVGVGEGRPFSPNSNGLGYGTWEIINPEK